MMRTTTALLISLFIALLLIIILGRTEASETLKQAFPLCLFTIAGGVFLIVKGGSIWAQLVGIAVIVSPLWLIHVVTWAFGLIGVVI